MIEDTIDKFIGISPDHIQENLPVMSKGIFFESGKIYPMKGERYDFYGRVYEANKNTILDNTEIDLTMGYLPRQAVKGERGWYLQTDVNILRMWKNISIRYNAWAEDIMRMIKVTRDMMARAFILSNGEGSDSRLLLGEEDDVVVMGVNDQIVYDNTFLFYYIQSAARTRDGMISYFYIEHVPDREILIRKSSGLQRYYFGEAIKAIYGMGEDIIICLDSASYYFNDLKFYRRIDVTTVAMKATVGLLIGASIALEVQVNPWNATDATFEWTSSDEEIATVQGGVVVGIAAGSVTITCISLDKRKSASTIVNVRTAAEAVTAVAFDVATVPVSGTFQILPALSPANATDQRCTFESSNGGVATISTTGLVTGISAGLTTITVRSVADPSKYLSKQLSVAGSPDNTYGKYVINKYAIDPEKIMPGVQGGKVSTDADNNIYTMFNGHGTLIEGTTKKKEIGPLTAVRSKYAVSCQNRLAIAYVKDSGKWYPRSVFISDTGKYHEFDSGVGTRIELADSKEEITGIVSLNGKIYVFKLNSISEITLSGTGIDIRENYIDSGGLVPQECQGLIFYYAVDKGICGFDGNTVVPISQPVLSLMPRFVNFIAKEAENGGVIFQADHIHREVGIHSVNALMYRNGQWSVYETLPCAIMDDKSKFIEREMKYLNINYLRPYIFKTKNIQGYYDEIFLEANYPALWGSVDVIPSVHPDMYARTVKERYVTFKREVPASPQRSLMELTVIGIAKFRASITTEFGTVALTAAGYDARGTVCPNIPGTKFEFTIYFDNEITEGDCIEKIVLRWSGNALPSRR